MCVIDENAMIDFSFVWFIPRIDPIKALSGDKINIDFLIDCIINIITDKGASFCHDDRIRQFHHDKDVITDGNHQ